MKHLIYSLLLILTCAPLGAQRVTPEVVATAGETFFNSTVILEWTLGEIMTETYTGSVVLTQGFHQPFRDVPPPVARCRETVTAQIDADGNLDLDPADLDDGSSDDNTAAADLNFRIDFGDYPLDCDNIRQPARPVTLVVTNTEGLTATCTSLVTVADTIPPVIICQDITLAIDEMGNRIQLFGFLDSIVVHAADNCDFFRVFSGDTTSFSCPQLGENNSVVFVEDRSFNTSSCEFVLTIIDPTFFCDDAPTAVCREAVTAQIDVDGNLDLDPADLDNGSFDTETPSAELTFSFAAAVPGCVAVFSGPELVGLVVTDNVGQTDTCFTQVTVIDTIPPILICQDTTIFLNDEGIGILGNLTGGVITQLTDNCVLAFSLSELLVFDCDDIGENVRTLTRRDLVGNAASCTFIVNVEDPTFACDAPPMAVCREAVTAQIDAEGNLDLDPASLDNGSFDDNTAAADLIFSLDFGGLVLDCDDVNKPAQPLDLVVTDNVGQTDTCTSLVTVIDTIPPVLICQDVTVDVSLEVFDLAASGAIDGSGDNCTEISVLSSSFAIDCELVGDNEINIAIPDEYGNVTTCEFILTVTDTTFLCSDAPPTAVCREAVTAQIDTEGNLDLDPLSLDNGSFDDDTATEDLGFRIDFGGLVLDCDDVGEPAQPVALVVTDSAGQTDTCFTLVTVEDNIAPEVTCQNVVIELEADQSTTLDSNLNANVILTDFSDNCAASPAAVTNTQTRTFDCDDIGVETRTFIYRDGNSNEGSCPGVRIQITDPLGVCGEDPIASCKPFTVPFDSFPAPTILLNANVFDDGSSDDRSVYTLVYSDATDRQENTTFDCSTTGSDQGQTFTAGQTGVIQSIKVRSGTAMNTELHLYDGNMANDPTVDPSFPDYSQDVELFFGQHSDQANLSVMTLDQPFPVVAGQEYTFILDLGSTLSRSCAGSAAYAAGQPINGFGLQDDPGGQDFTFEVNIIGPNEMEFPNAGGTLVTVFAVDDEGNVSDGCQTFINPDQPLPVAWLSFSANAGEKTVDLRWETSEEPDNAGFHVERFAVGQEWTTIAQVPARTGPDQHYAFTDNAPLPGFNCYRIRQTDTDGRIAYSRIETLNFFPDDPVTLYPNPTTREINVQLPAGAELLGLLTISGRDTDTHFKGEDDRLQADVSGLPAGVYFLRIRLADGTPTTKRLVVH